MISIAFLPCFISHSQIHTGSELEIKVNVFEYESRTFPQKLFDRNTSFEPLWKSNSADLVPQKRVVKVFSVSEKNDTSWFNQDKDYFIQAYFNRKEDLWLKLNNDYYRVPEKISSVAGNVTEINLYFEANHNSFKRNTSILSIVRSGHSLLPKKNFILKGKKVKKLISIKGENFSYILEFLDTLQRVEKPSQSSF